MNETKETKTQTPEQWEASIYERAIGRWGERAQMLKAIEEMGELSRALLRLIFLEDYAMGDRKQIEQAIAKERADVEIMLNQLHFIFGDNSAMEVTRLEELERRLEREEKKEDRLSAKEMILNIAAAFDLHIEMKDPE